MTVDIVEANTRVFVELGDKLLAGAGASAKEVLNALDGFTGAAITEAIRPFVHNPPSYLRHRDFELENSAEGHRAVVRAEKKVSTEFSHEPEVGV